MEEKINLKYNKFNLCLTVKYRFSQVTIHHLKEGRRGLQINLTIIHYSSKLCCVLAPGAVGEVSTLREHHNTMGIKGAIQPGQVIAFSGFVLGFLTIQKGGANEKLS